MRKLNSMSLTCLNFLTFILRWLLILTLRKSSVSLLHEDPERNWWTYEFYANIFVNVNAQEKLFTTINKPLAFRTNNHNLTNENKKYPKHQPKLTTYLRSFRENSSYTPITESLNTGLCTFVLYVVKAKRCNSIMP